jgi:hypothetical protein
LIWRVRLDSGESVVVKRSEYEGADVEVRFYREVENAPAPRCHYAAIEDDGRVLLVLEDLTRGRPGDGVLGCSLDDAVRVLERMAAFREPGDGFPRWADRLAMRQKRYDASVGFFLERYADRFPREIQLLAERLRGRLGAVMRPLLRDECLIHGDLHLDNVIFDRDRAVVIDWQTACLAPPALDFVTFAYSAVSIDDRRVLESEFGMPGIPRALLNAFAGHVIWLARPDLDELTGRERAYVDAALTDGRLVSGLLEHGTSRLLTV